MKLVLAIVSNYDTNSVCAALNKQSFQVTKLATTGGFLSLGNTTLMIGCENEDVDKVIEIIGSESKRRSELLPSTAPYDVNAMISIPVEVQVGGATIFVLDIDRFEKI